MDRSTEAIFPVLYSIWCVLNCQHKRDIGFESVIFYKRDFFNLLGDNDKVTFRYIAKSLHCQSSPWELPTLVMAGSLGFWSAQIQSKSQSCPWDVPKHGGDVFRGALFQGQKNLNPPPETSGEHLDDFLNRFISCQFCVLCITDSLSAETDKILRYRIRWFSSQKKRVQPGFKDVAPAAFKAEIMNLCLILISWKEASPLVENGDCVALYLSKPLTELGGV